MNALKTCVHNPNMTVPYLLMASYLYYCKDESPPLLDHEFDWLCRYAKQNWSQIQHRHKNLIKRSWLDAGSLFKLREDEYPLLVKSAAYAWLSGIRPSISDVLARITYLVEKFIGDGF